MSRAFFLALCLSLLASPASVATRLDLASFARPCCAQDDYRLQTTFDSSHPRGAVQTADGRFVYGLQ